MTHSDANIHATAIVVGTTGMLFIGPSGAGKSALAFACLAEARQGGEFAALVADDQVLVRIHDGKVIGLRPAPIRGLIELRHSGIACVESLPAALLQYVVVPVEGPDAERLPPEEETHAVVGAARLPLLRIALGASTPLAWLRALISSRRSYLGQKSL